MVWRRPSAFALGVARQVNAIVCPQEPRQGGGHGRSLGEPGDVVPRARTTPAACVGPRRLPVPVSYRRYGHQVVLRMIPRTPPPGQRYWQPFERSPLFNDRWWCTWGDSRLHEYLSVLDGDVEVVRLRLGHNWQTYYVGVPAHVRRDGLEIQLIETAADQRRHRYASRAVEALASAHPDRVVVAYGESDEFWQALGWDQYQHEDAAESPQLFQTLFVDPSRSTAPS